MKSSIHKLWYLSTAAQTVWALILYGGWFVLSGALDRYIDFVGADNTGVSSHVTQVPDWLRQPLAGIVFVAVIIVTVVILIRTPKHAADITIRSTAVTQKRLEPVVKDIINHTSTRSVTRKEISFVSRMLITISIFVLTIPAHQIVSEIDPMVSWPVSILLGSISLLALCVAQSKRFV